MGDPKIFVNTYTDSPTGHTNITFVDGNGVLIGTWGANLGPTSLPGSLGGVYAESSSRIPSYRQEIIFDSTAHHLWNSALFYAQESARITAGGAGDYFFIGINCYDFVDAVLQEAGYNDNTAYIFMEPGSIVHSYGIVQSLVTDPNWSYFLSLMTNDPTFQPVTSYQLQQTTWLVEALYSEDEGLIIDRISRIENETWVSPLAIDLQGNGFDIISLNENVIFSYIEDNPLRTAWLGPTDGFLVIDYNMNGLIEDLGEMFGGRAVGDAFFQLAKKDSNNDGVIDVSDPEFSQLRIWIDSDSNAVSNLGELYSLQSLEISSIDVTPQFSKISLGDAFIAEHSTAVVDGVQVQFSDIFFRTREVIDQSVAGMSTIEMIA